MTAATVYWSVLQYKDIRLQMAATDSGFCRIVLPNEPKEALRHWVDVRIPGASLARDDARFHDIAGELQQYFDGECRTFNLPLDLRGTPFQISVWHSLAEIPFGEVRSYSDIAQAIGRPTAVRAVAAANGQNPLPLVLPCHRVIGKNGTLTGFHGGLRLKQRLLQLEGVQKVSARGHARFNF